MTILNIRSFAVSILLLISLHLRAQELMHGFGLKMAVLMGRVTDADNYEDIGMEINQFSYFPRYNFLEGENTSLSFGLPLAAGIGLATAGDYSDIGVMLAYDLPVALDFNFGNKSSLDNDRYFGGYFGLGYGYTNVKITGSSYSNFKGAVYGPLVRLGVRISSPDRSWQGHALDVGLFFKKGMGDNELYMGGFNVLYAL